MKVDLAEGLWSKIFGDKSRFQQVLMNLVSNACKFAPFKSRVDTFVNFDTHLNQVIVSVTDYGPGLNQKEIEQLFTPFARKVSPKSERINPNGVGLGLFISKRICTMLQGNIIVASTPNQKTTFTFRIKASPVMV